jgi:F-type H+-transporting ATPase subunit b
VYTVSVTHSGAGGLQVRFAEIDGHVALRPQGAEEGTEELDEGPSPIAPEPKEFLWGLGAFLVFLVVMRLFLVPKVKRGMQARYGRISSGHERAESLRDSARREVAEYEAALAAVHAEAATRVEASRQVLEGERAERLGTANAAIAERRAAAAAEVDAAKSAARDSIEGAAADVAGRAVELVAGRRPDDAAVRRAVADVASVGVGS